MKAKKAQALSVEFIISLVIFVAILGGLYGYYNAVLFDYVETSEIAALDSSFTLTYTQLFLTQGRPHNWEYENVSETLPNAIGISDGVSGISESKLTTFVSLNDTNYSDMKDSLYVGNDSELYVEFYAFNGTEFVENTSLTFGTPLISYSGVKAAKHYFVRNGVLHYAQLEVYYE